MGAVDYMNDPCPLRSGMIVTLSQAGSAMVVLRQLRKLEPRVFRKIVGIVSIGEEVDFSEGDARCIAAVQEQVRKKSLSPDAVVSFPDEANSDVPPAAWLQPFFLVVAGHAISGDDTRGWTVAEHLSTIQPEITAEQVEEFLRKREDEVAAAADDPIPTFSDVGLTPETESADVTLA